MVAFCYDFCNQMKNMSLSTDEIRIKNLINLYDTLTLRQIEVLGNLKSAQQKKIIDNLIKKKAIKIDYLADGIEVYCNYYSSPNRKLVLVGEVLKELIINTNSTVLWFQKQEYPFTAIAYIKNKIFDIAAIEDGEEEIFNVAVNRIINSETGNEENGYKNSPAPRKNILIIIENAEKISKIQIPNNDRNVVFACTDLKNSDVQFIAKPTI